MGFKHKLSFQASSASGAKYTLDVFVRIIDVATRGDPHATKEVPGFMRTSGGQAVNREDRGRYKIVDTGEILTSDDPNAP